MTEPCDILVVGAGSAGIAAAVSAARAGGRTLLLDSRDGPGGTGGFSGLTTLCGLFDGQGNWLNDGLSREFAERVAECPPVRMGKVWVLPYRPEKFRESAAELLASTPNLQTRWNTPLATVTALGSHISTVNEFHPGAVIDCTGTAEVARLLGLECLETVDSTQAPAVVFALEKVDCDLTSAAAVTRAMLPLARAGLPGISFLPGPGKQTATAKFAGRPEQVPQVISILRAEAAGFGQCEARQSHFEISRRAGRMIPGAYLLTGADVLAGRKFEDAVARCAWPIEQWDARGKMSVRHLPENRHYEIPARSLRAASLQNLFMAGKSISADAEAIASARVMGCCLATGAAAGALAAASVATGVAA